MLAGTQSGQLALLDTDSGRIVAGGRTDGQLALLSPIGGMRQMMALTQTLNAYTVALDAGPG
ncbi:MAG: hypothetical protein R3F14_29325 [Polyangiaceae bacterium]